MVRAALADSGAVSVVPEAAGATTGAWRLKATLKPAGRSTLILRDIPTDAPEDEVRAIFDFPECKPISAVRSDIGDTWFVSLDSEEDAKDTVLALRVHKRLFRGQAVKARVKTDTVLRSYYPAAVPPTLPPPLYPAVIPFPLLPTHSLPHPADPSLMVPYFLAAPPLPGSALDAPLLTTPADPERDGEGLAAGEKPATPASDASPSAAHVIEVVGRGRGASGSRDAAHAAGGNSHSHSNGNGSSGGAKRPAASAGTSAARAGDSRQAAASAGRAKAADRPAAGKKGGRDDAAAAPSTPAKAPIEVDAVNFTPLGEAPAGPVPVSGDAGPFKRYSFDEIIGIVKSVKEAKLPAEIKPVSLPNHTN